MIVVGIVAVLSSISAINLSRQKERSTIRQELLGLRGAIQRSRTLSAQAGSKLGTTRVVLDPSCWTPPSNDRNSMWIVFDPNANRASVPTRLVSNLGSDIAAVSCEVFSVGINNIGYRGVFARTANVPAFAFASNGRLIGDAGSPIPPSGWAEVVTHPDDGHNYGFRVLPSGIVCDSTTVNLPAGAALCDEDF